VGNGGEEYGGTFGKLFGSRLANSSLLDCDVATRWVFIFMLANADKNGFFRCAHATALSRACNISKDAAETAIRELEAPDPHSMSPEAEGRRILKIAGGWQLVTYEKYRDMYSGPGSSTERVRRHREKKRNACNVTETPVTGGTVSNLILSNLIGKEGNSAEPSYSPPPAKPKPKAKAKPQRKKKPRFLEWDPELQDGKGALRWEDSPAAKAARKSLIARFEAEGLSYQEQRTEMAAVNRWLRLNADRHVPGRSDYRRRVINWFLRKIRWEAEAE